MSRSSRSPDRPAPARRRGKGSSLPPPAVDAVALGGLNEFGTNAFALRCGDTAILIDSGGVVPPPEASGATLVIPDLSYGARYQGFAALFLTHGHEDHIAAVPYILPLVRGPIFGTPLTLALVELLLSSCGIGAKDRLVPVQFGSSTAVGPFEVEFIQVTHSMPDCAALAIRTPVGTLIHSGDFKVDATPVDGRPMALDRLKALGRAGVLALFGESTSAEIPGYAGSDSSLTATYREVFATSPGRIIIVTYASNLHLLQIIVDLATEADRVVAFMGYRLGSLTQAAERLGRLHIPAGVRVRDNRVGEVPPSRLVCVVTGSQGTPGSTLALLADDVHRALKIERGDRIVFAAGTIPGNEPRVEAIQDALVRLGAEIIEGDRVHVSGHARQEELKLLASMIQPRFFVPVHGMHQSLVTHAQLVHEVTGGRTRTLVVDNGDVVRFEADAAAVVERVPTRRLIVEGRQMEPMGGPAVEERLRMATGGGVFVVVTRRRTGDIADIRIESRGLIGDALLSRCLRESIREARVSLDRLSRAEQAHDATVKQAVEAAVSTVFQNELSKAPIVATVVIPV